MRKPAREELLVELEPVRGATHTHTQDGTISVDDSHKGCVLSYLSLLHLGGVELKSVQHGTMCSI